MQGSLALSIAETPKERDKNHRNPRAQRKYGGPVKEYDGGHLIATLFQGPAEKVNLVPQLAEQNRHGEWRQMETMWARKIKNGNEIDIEIQIQYDEQDESPIELIAMYSINGGKPKTQNFNN